MADSIILEQKAASGAGAKASKRKRLYIFPTRHGLVYACLLVVMLIGAVNYTNNMAYMLTFMLGSLFMVCMLHTCRNLRGLVVSVSEAKPVFAGETARFPVVFDNREGPRRGSVNVQAPSTRRFNAGPGLVHQAVAAGQMQRDYLPVPARARGYYRPGRLKIHSNYPLGLFHAWSWLETRSGCVIYPKPAGNPALPALVEDISRDQYGTQAGTDDFTGFRRYRTGDSIRNIDWKAHARERGLLVKKFSGSGARKLVLHWDQTAQLADTEARLSQMALWIVRAEQAGLQYGIVLPGARIDTGHGEAHQHDCLRELALYGNHADT